MKLLNLYMAIPTRNAHLLPSVEVVKHVDCELRVLFVQLEIDELAAHLGKHLHERIVDGDSRQFVRFERHQRGVERVDRGQHDSFVQITDTGSLVLSELLTEERR